MISNDMEETIDRFQELIHDGMNYFSSTPTIEMQKKPSPLAWSKNEILGHLIDSGVNNLQRFTEIQFEEKPYPIRKYKQNELVLANDYQNAETKEIAALWKSLNFRILNLIKLQTEESLAYKILNVDNKIADLNFLIQDYINHLEHHLNQIIEKEY